VITDAMASFFLDTGILIGYVRGAAFASYVDQKYAPSRAPNVAMISVATSAELHSMGLRLGWGPQKQAKLSSLLRSLPIIPIRQAAVVQKFAEIDAYNHRQHPTLPPPTSGHTMGDNDIWIAATAAVLNATLITTDHDFDHLNRVFLPVVFIDQKLGPNDA
jgi:tRNA(fMet)-specific endonuclease VapC